jgi:hypothetical protein
MNRNPAIMSWGSIGHHPRLRRTERKSEKLDVIAHFVGAQAIANQQPRRDDLAD